MRLWTVIWHWNDNRGNKIGGISYETILLHIFFKWVKAIRSCLVEILKTKYTFYDSVSYIKLFMTTMKMKNGNQYKIQKSQDGGGNNANKNFTSRVEQGYIPNTTSYLELFMNIIKIKYFCNRYQYKMQKSWDGGGNNAY